MRATWPSHFVLSLAASLLATAINPLYASEPTEHYRIPAGTLSGALLAVSKQTKQLIVFTPADINSLSAQKVDGDFTVEQVLRTLLEGHALTYERDSRGAIIVRPLIKQDGTVEAESTLPALVVFGERQEEGGLTTTTTSTTRTGTPLRHTPQSITVINSEVMKAQGARTVTDALQNVSGVAVIPGSLGAASVSVRGYRSSVVSEGLGTSSSSSPLAVPAIALQSVEAIKGPSAILTGSGSPGGTINLVYKKPQLESANEVRLGYGTYDERQISVDTTGAILNSENLSYRAVLDNRESSRNSAGYDGLKDLYFSPSIRWQDEDTDLTVRYARTERTSPFSPYTFGFEGKPWNGHIPEPLGNKDDSLTLEQNEFTYSLDQLLSEHWTFVSKGAYTSAKSEQYGWYSGTILQPDGDVWMNSFAQGSQAHQLGLDNYFRGTYEFGDLKSTSVLGVSASRVRAINKNQTVYGDWWLVDINQPRPDFPAVERNYRESFSESIPVGAYWQQHLSYGQWHLNTGLRFSSSWNGVFRRNDASSSQKKQVWSPSIGLAYEAAPWVTIYASHLEGYQPPSYTDRNGNLLPEQVSKQNEAGLKFTLLDERIVLTTAVYRTEFSNYAYFDMNEGGYVAVPGYLSRGVEIEAQGSITKNWDVVGYYNYGKTDFTEDSDYKAGLPRHKASLWTRYRINDGLFKGVSTGVGVYYSGIAYLDRNEEYQIPAQVQTDLSLGYTVDNYSLDLVARNILNEDLYVTSLEGNPTFISIQQPRSVQLTATYRF